MTSGIRPSPFLRNKKRSSGTYDGIQSGGTVNALFLREKLFNFVDVVVAPVLIGGKDTTTLIDGHSLQSRDELNQLGVLRLIEATPLQDSYLRLRYQVIG